MGDSSGMPAAESSTTTRTITRRTVTRGVAWSAPLAAVAVAAPAFASSIPCQVTTVLDNLTPGTPVGVLTFLPSTITATIGFANGAGTGQLGDTGLVARTTTTPAWNYIEVEMTDPLNVGDYIDVTIQLSAPVTNVGFRIHDIDKTAEGWNDQVIVQTSGFTVPNKGTDVIGIGSGSNLNATDAQPGIGPFRNQHTGDQAIDSGRNFVDLKWAGPIQQLKFRYRAGMTGNSGNQHIGIGNISFSDCIANPNGKSAARSVNLGAAQFAPSKGAALVEGRDN